MMLLCETSTCSLAVCMISIVNCRLPKLLPGGKSKFGIVFGALHLQSMIPVLQVPVLCARGGVS